MCSVCCTWDFSIFITMSHVFFFCFFLKKEKRTDVWLCVYECICECVSICVHKCSSRQNGTDSCNASHYCHHYRVRGYCVYLWMHLAYVLAQTTISTTIKPITMGHWGHPALHWTVQSHHHHQTHYQANHITLYFNTLCVLHLNKLFHNKKGGKL